MINCDICKEIICKYELDWNACGGIQIVIKEQCKNICYECAKAITMMTIEDNL